MNPTPPTLDEQRLVRGRAQLDALAEPTRLAIFETLQLGPASIRDIGARIGRDPASLYRHMALLEAVELVRRTGQVPTERRAAWVYACLHPRPALLYEPDDPGRLESLAGVVEQFAAHAGRQFKAALGRPTAVTRGPARNLHANGSLGWLDADQLARANALIDELAELLHAGTRRPDTQLVSLAMILRPLAADDDAHPARDEPHAD